jgi:hypothetical protein
VYLWVYLWVYLFPWDCLFLFPWNFLWGFLWGFLFLCQSHFLVAGSLFSFGQATTLLNDWVAILVPVPQAMYLRPVFWTDVKREVVLEL